MGSNVEKDIYSLAKNYLEVTFSKKRPPLDYELNELQKIQTGLRERFIRNSVADGPSGDGFLVDATGNPNEIRVRSGFLYSNGQTLYMPDDKIINTLSTPSGADREDLVYVEWYVREVDSVEDPALIDIINVGFETAVRQTVDFDVFVIEGALIPAPAPGRTQYILSTLNRIDSVDIVDSTQIVDDRVKSGLNYVLDGGRAFQTGDFTFNFEGASGLVGGSHFSVIGSSQSIGINEIRFLYVSDTEALILAASLPTTYHVPLAKITSNALGITSIEDLRRHVPLASSGGGTNSVLNLTTLDTVAEYQSVRVSGVNTVLKSDASSVTSMPVFGITLDSGLIGQEVRVLTSGIVTNPLWAFTAGAEIYASEITPGELTETPPTTTGTVVQKLGIAIRPDTMYFNPDLTYDVNGGVGSHAQNTDVGSTTETFTIRLGETTDIGSPAGFCINRGLSLPDVCIRHQGAYWEFTNDGVSYEKLGGAFQSFRFDTVGDGINATFTLPQPYIVGGNNLLVFAGSTLMNPTDDYIEFSNTEVTFNTIPLAGEALTFIVGLGGGDVILDDAHEHDFETFEANGLDSFVTLTKSPIARSTIISVRGMMHTEGPTLDYTVTGNTVTFSTLPDAGDRITVHYAYLGP
jgi:hypothetical protein